MKNLIKSTRNFFTSNIDVKNAIAEAEAINKEFESRETYTRSELLTMHDIAEEIKRVNRENACIWSALVNHQIIIKNLLK